MASADCGDTTNIEFNFVNFVDVVLVCNISDSFTPAFGVLYSL